MSINSTYTKVSNTLVSNTSIAQALTGDDVRALNFQDAVNCLDPVAVGAGGAGTYTALTTDQLVQAATSRLLVVGGTLSTAARLDLGADTVANAATYVSLFNLTSTNQQRTLTFTNVGTAQATSAVNLSVASGVSSNQIRVALATALASGEQALFTSTSSLSVQPTQCGASINVTVYGTNVSAGSEVVVFSVNPANARVQAT